LPISVHPGFDWFLRLPLSTSTDYDPVCMGYQITASAAPEDNLDLRCLGSKTDPEAGRFTGGFRLDTALRGNRNTGHEFNDGAHARQPQYRP
jgi:hypothetical protein